MKIGDVSAPSALLRPSDTRQDGAGFVRTLGSIQRAYSERRPARLYEISDRQERERAFNMRLERLTTAAQALTHSAEPGAAEPREESDGERRVAEGREIETLQTVADGEFRGLVEEFVAAFNGLRKFVDQENFDVGDGFGLLGSDDRVRAVTEVLHTIDFDAEDRTSRSGSSLADIGILRDGSGGLRIDPEALTRAIDRDPAAVEELLGGGNAGLSQAVLSGIGSSASPTPEPTASLDGFLGGLSTREDRLSDEASLLETVVQGLSHAATASPAE